jgi:hypothetical protein
MKLKVHIIVIFTLIAITALSQTVFAQTSRPSSKVDVPFAFDYGKQHFAAGIYTVSMRDQNILTLSGVNRTAWTMIQAGYDPTQHKNGYVTFRKYGNRYFLTEFSPANASIVASVFESHAERSVARDFADSHLAPSHVHLALMSNAGD